MYIQGEEDVCVLAEGRALEHRQVLTFLALLVLKYKC
jgi:hypothetical protein